MKLGHIASTCYRSGVQFLRGVVVVVVYSQNHMKPNCSYGCVELRLGRVFDNYLREGLKKINHFADFSAKGYPHPLRGK